MVAWLESGEGLQGDHSVPWFIAQCWQPGDGCRHRRQFW